MPIPPVFRCGFRRRNGQIVPDQIRTVDKNRLVKRLGKIYDATAQKVLALLNECSLPDFRTLFLVSSFLFRYGSQRTTLYSRARPRTRFFGSLHRNALPNPPRITLPLL